MKGRSRALALVAAATLVLGACGAGGGYQRGIFTGSAASTRAEERHRREASASPDRVDAAELAARRQLGLQARSTFDPDDMNKSDARRLDRRDEEGCSRRGQARSGAEARVFL